MKPDKVRDLLEKVTELIPEKPIQKYVRQAFDCADEKFFQAPASSSGKYHPPENNLIGGLTGIHTIKVALYGHDFAERSCPQQKGSVIAACLLHDIRKGNKDNGKWEGYAFDHAFQAYSWLNQFDLAETYKEQIRACVRTHMCDMTEPEQEKELAKPWKISLPQLCVQHADQAASAMWASFFPGIDTRTLLEIKTDNPDEVLDKLMNLKNLENAINKLWKNRW